MGLRVFDLPVFLLTIVRICVLFLIIKIVMKSEIWITSHCLGLGNETMVCTLCLVVFSLWPSDTTWRYLIPPWLRRHNDVIKWKHILRYWSFVRETTGHRWIPLIKIRDAERWCSLWSTPEQTVEHTIDTPVIWDAIALIMTSLQWLDRYLFGKPLPETILTYWQLHFSE